MIEPALLQRNEKAYLFQAVGWHDLKELFPARLHHLCMNTGLTIERQAYATVARRSWRCTRSSIEWKSQQERPRSVSFFQGLASVSPVD